MRGLPPPLSGATTLAVIPTVSQPPLILKPSGDCARMSPPQGLSSHVIGHPVDNTVHNVHQPPPQTPRRNRAPPISRFLELIERGAILRMAADHLCLPRSYAMLSYAQETRQRRCDAALLGGPGLGSQQRSQTIRQCRGSLIDWHGNLV